MSLRILGGPFFVRGFVPQWSPWGRGCAGIILRPNCCLRILKQLRPRPGSQHDLGAAEMSDTPEEPEPGTNADRQDTLVDLGLKLAGLPDELLLQLAETHGNPLALLVSKAHLSKTFCEAARAAQATLTHIDLAIGDGRSTTQWWLRWSQSAPSSRISTFVAAASPTRQWERWPRTASSSRCSICVAAVGSPTRR